jgi:hypothetical protein
MTRGGLTNTPKPEATATRLLRAASDMLGSNKLLAERLGISQSMLIKYMAGMSDVPPAVVLRCSDMLLEERKSETPDD